MTKYLLIVAALGLIFTAVQYPAYSQSPTEEVSENLEEEVQDLKDKVAEKVEELKGQNKKAVSGVVQEVTSGIITMLNANDENVEVEIDDTLTSFYDIIGTKINESTFEDIEKGSYIFVTGPEIGETITANEVYVDTQYIVVSGKITEVNAEDFSVRIVTVDKSNYILDVEKNTKQHLLDIKTLETDAIGFTKLKEGDSVHVVVKGDPTEPDKERFTAIKLLIIPNEYFLQ